MPDILRDMCNPYSPQICVIQEGAVVESGTHSDLMATKGVYYNLNKSAKKN